MQKHKLEEKQLRSPNQLKQPKNSVEAIHRLFQDLLQSLRKLSSLYDHTMMKVFGGFVISLGIVGGWLPLSFSVALTGLEILVAFLQAYVFAILTCIYLNDALNLHH